MDSRDNIYNLPRRTEEILIKLNPTQECENLGLLLDKYVPKSVFEKPNRENQKAGKTPWLLSILKPKGENKTQNNHINVLFAKEAYNRWHVMMSAMQATLFNATLDWRMVIGLGGETVLETDITLHHLYGTPFIPGSALKGLARAYAAGEDKEYYIPINRPKDERKPSMKEETDHPDVQRIFGTQKEAGTVLFFDAMPLDGKATFVLDIMNPHYPDYYNSLKASQITPPTNDQSPVPVTFLTVTNTIFTFALAPRNSSIEQHVKDVEQVKKWLQEALQKYGVGGKTSAGYGYFRKADDKDTAPASPASVQTARTPQVPATQENWQRPNIPQFREGQEIQNCVVIQPTEMMRRYSSKASAFLRYREFPPKYVYVVIEETPSEAKNWKPNESKSCIFIREEQYEGSLVLVCKPKPPKNKDKKK